METTSGDLLGVAAFLAVAIAGARWWRGVQAVQLPRDARPYLLACGAGVLLGGAALIAGPGLLAGILAVVAMLGGGAFLGLFAASGQRSAVLHVAVGSPAPAIVARDADDRPFALEALHGRPVLLKFFRGHWCPYCVAELRRWRELEPDLARRGVVVVAVCSDTAEAIRAGRGKHALEATLLPDPDLAITDRYGLRNPRNFAPKPGLVVPLPIPTTILIDAGGVVRWIDQSSDYMRRSDPGVVRAALALLDPAAARRAS